MDTTGGAIIAQMLKQEGVEKFFGIVDGTYTQLFAHCVELGLEMITPRHEAVAAHMAGAYALQPVRDMFKTALGPDHSRTINTDLGEIGWDRLADAMGAYGERVSSPDELEPALRRCLAEKRCAVIHVDVDPTAHMFAPGLQYFKDMHQEPAG